MTTGCPSRILVVDDSAVVRSLLRSVITSDPALELAATAADGKAALGMLANLKPDLVLLDVEMPVMDGLATLRTLRAQGHRIPVIMCSTLTHRGAAVTVDALVSGASDYIAKPASGAGVGAPTLNPARIFAEELLRKIHALTRRPAQPLTAPLFERAIQDTAESRAIQPGGVPTIVVIGVSTGGPAALEAILPALPGTFPLPVLIVQHMPELFTRLLAERLAPRCALPVVEAAEGDLLRAGRIVIARGNWHLEVLSPARAGSATTLHLTQSSPENHCRPSVDVLFRSASAACGSGVLAVVLTGMGSDGLAGAQVVRAHRGTVLAQDEATSTVWGMPGAVGRAGLAHRILPLQSIGPELVRMAGARPFAQCGQVIS